MKAISKKSEFRLTRYVKQIIRVDGYSLMELIMVIILMTIAIPAIVSMYTTVLTNSHNAEYMTIADLLAIEQVETILADKAGTSAGFGYASINTARYAAVNPPAPFTAFTRTVTVTTINTGLQYEYKQITVTVSHALIPDVELVTAIFDHTGL